VPILESFPSILELENSYFSSAEESVVIECVVKLLIFHRQYLYKYIEKKQIVLG